MSSIGGSGKSVPRGPVSPRKQTGVPLQRASEGKADVHLNDSATNFGTDQKQEGRPFGQESADPPIKTSHAIGLSIGRSPSAPSLSMSIQGSRNEVLRLRGGSPSSKSSTSSLSTMDTASSSEETHASSKGKQRALTPPDNIKNELKAKPIPSRNSITAALQRNREKSGSELTPASGPSRTPKNKLSASVSTNILEKIPTPTLRKNIVTNAENIHRVGSPTLPDEPKKIGEYNLHQHGFFGYQGQPKKTSKEARWKQKNIEPTLPSTNENTILPEKPHWGVLNLEDHIAKHKNEAWFKSLYGTGLDGEKKYAEQAVAFLKTPPTPLEIKRYDIRCNTNERGENDVLLYSWRNNMIGIAHENGYIHTFYSPRNGEQEVIDIVRKRET